MTWNLQMYPLPCLKIILRVPQDVYSGMQYKYMYKKFAGDHPRSHRQKKTNSTRGTFHSDHIKTGEISYCNLALHNVQELSLVREYPSKPSGTISDAREG